MASTGSAAQSWARALEEWAIPSDVLDRAPESPWHFSPELFASVARYAVENAQDSVSRLRALEVLPEGGSVLDVGVGGGAASLPLVPPAGLITGLDPSEEMLAVFASAAEEFGVAHREVLGNWPDAAAEVEPADVVVSHNVLYNVPDLVPFVTALTARARRRVVVQITGDHPLSRTNPMWRAIHGLERPTSPTAEDALAVLAEVGYDVHHEDGERRWPRLHRDRKDLVASLRRQLCVGPERDAEIESLLTPEIEEPVRRVVTMWWDV